ncbi:MAG: carbohydrate porin [Bryobacteraceae bacterium]
MGRLRVFSLVLIFCFLSSLGAQDVVQDFPTPAPDTGSNDSFWSRFWISGQANFIRQQHGDFPAAYSGPNSLKPYAEHATSRVLTLYTGFQITKNLEILADVEEAGGGGLSNALGVAGFTNLDVVRNPSLSKAAYMAREMLHYTVPLSGESGEATRNPLSLASTLPVRRLEFRLGKMSTVDFFDVNSVGSDSHLQFMNWTLVNNGAFDYAADTRGYTYGLLIEYYDRNNWVFRFGEMLMPTVANGVTLDWDIARARGENWELELHHELFPHRTSVLRLLSFVNHANMGSYREAIAGYLSGQDPVPNITEFREQGRVKYGFGVNVEQPLTSQWRAFGRLGWNNGSTESFAYTEVDRTASIGSDLIGKLWHRSNDKVGAAFVTNGISSDHREYLALGGLGFILGDGGLTYGLEKIFETYYTAHIWRGVSFAADWQHITNPGYNEARGPVSVVSFRIHIEDAIPFDKFGAH